MQRKGALLITLVGSRNEASEGSEWGYHRSPSSGSISPQKRFSPDHSRGLPQKEDSISLEQSLSRVLEDSKSESKAKTDQIEFFPEKNLLVALLCFSSSSLGQRIFGDKYRGEFNTSEFREEFKKLINDDNEKIVSDIEKRMQGLEKACETPQIESSKESPDHPNENESGMTPGSNGDIPMIELESELTLPNSEDIEQILADGKKDVSVDDQI
eukprot:TRINITY_DN14688_c0_g1_i1.p1 TRINITY_DN14688_c0_g1~~TRINITY_DN14688_c0_g1_i1.p1  ORF type:complete len:213 (-),score=24.06 TRINITY_DN14688_c0_g1_i1:24-662(-)